MDKKTAKTEMFLGSWIVAACAGVLAAVLLWVLGSWSFMQGAFIGVVVFILAGVLVSWLMASPMSPPADATPAAKPAPAKSAPAAAAPTATQAEPVAKKKPAAKKNAPAAKKVATAKKAATATSDDPRPELLSDAPGAGGADDLKLISGVGPKLEQTLNELGVWHFEQVAAFKKKDIEWVDARLRFKGRIERDDWMSQAKTLAAGGETEFSKKKSKG